ncbi:MAG: hypothetical protein ACRDPY_13285 [Streptosporangiaceae bacterium]
MTIILDKRAGCDAASQGARRPGRGRQARRIRSRALAWAALLVTAAAIIGCVAVILACGPGCPAWALAAAAVEMVAPAGFAAACWRVFSSAGGRL